MVRVARKSGMTERPWTWPRAEGLAAIVVLCALATAVAVTPAAAWQSQPAAAPQQQAEPQQQTEPPPPPPSLFGRPSQPAQPAPAALPPADSPTLLRSVALQFPTQGNVPGVDVETYLYYMEITRQVSRPSEGRWTPYTEEIAETVLGDYQRLWNTGFLNDLWVEVIDQPYENGVQGKTVIFNIAERERVKIVSYEGSEELETDEILTNQQENGIELRLDSFIDPEMIRNVKSLIRAMFASKGYMFAEVDHAVETLPGGPKLVHLTFQLDQGPKVEVEEIDFVGNSAYSDGKLSGQMENIKERWWLSWATGRGTYKPEEYEEDADRIVEFYRNEGYITARVGQPELEYLDAPEDAEKRGLNLRIPVDEGERYRIGELAFAGNEILLEEGLRQIFDDIELGDYYSEKKIREGFDEARELYGSLGYYEMTLAPDLLPRVPPEADADAVGDSEQSAATGDDARPLRIRGAPVVDVTIRVQEGAQYFVNRIEFTGNQTTHDEVIRRELQIAENAVFNTEALQHSVRRLNQLGFFEPLEETGVGVEKVEAQEGEDPENATNEVDVTFELTEANLNQLTFGAGYSQFDGVFGQVGFQTTNFMGRGETLGVSVQHGQWAQNSQVSFTRPYNFGRPLSLGTQVFRRKVDWIGSFAENAVGGTASLGMPLSLYTRAFLIYSLERTEATIGQGLEQSLQAGTSLFAANPFFADALNLSTGGYRVVSKITPQLSFNTVDHPIFPTRGSKFSLALEVAGVGGNTNFLKPILEGTWYKPHTARTVFGVRVQYSHLQTDNPATIPVFERLWLGGEYSVRGFDIRRVGPLVSETNPDVALDSYTGRIVMGGNKSLLVNAEYQFLLGGPVRLLAFLDAGQVQDFGNDFVMDQFQTSTGLELRFFMPMLNVPFRLIYYYNFNHEEIFNDRFEPQEQHGFRFAMGTTF